MRLDTGAELAVGDYSLDSRLIKGGDERGCFDTAGQVEQGQGWGSDGQAIVTAEFPGREGRHGIHAHAIERAAPSANHRDTDPIVRGYRQAPEPG